MKTLSPCVLLTFFLLQSLIPSAFAHIDDIVIEAQNFDDRPAEEIIPAPPVDIWDRIRRGYRMPELQTNRVAQQTRLYVRNPEYIDRMCQRASQYLYHIVEEIEKRNMPTELALLPFVESAFQPEALSRAKAAGLWQFMPSTGSLFDLQQNLWKDERRDVIESTRAALDYLQKLYETFGDWHLALAAYNWGEGSVLRAIRTRLSRGVPATYTSLRMPRETANYVPKLQAIKNIINNPEKYGIKLPEIENTPYFVHITKNRDIDTKTAAFLANMELDDFRKLNPGFNLPVIVASHNSSFLLPSEKAEDFLDNLANWVNAGKDLSTWMLHKVQSTETLSLIAQRYGMAEDELRLVNHIPNGRKVLPGSTLLVSRGNEPALDIPQSELSACVALSVPLMRRIVYRVHRKDTVFSIARKFKVTQASIRERNRLGKNRLRIGQRLIIEVPYRTNLKNSPSTNKTTYTVQKGDTLFSISQRLGTTVSKLQKLNQLRSTQIFVGETLRIN